MFELRPTSDDIRAGSERRFNDIVRRYAIPQITIKFRLRSLTVYEYQQPDSIRSGAKRQDPRLVASIVPPFRWSQ